MFELSPERAAAARPERCLRGAIAVRVAGSVARDPSAAVAAGVAGAHRLPLLCANVK